MTVPAFTPAGDQSFRKAAAVVKAVQEAERAAFAQGDPKSPTLPWMPFPPGEFMSFMFECVPELKGRDFLDVGCGPGTKMQLASHFFGLHACGIEIDQAMAVKASKHGDVWNENAIGMPPGTYAGWDLIWLYRPFRDPDMETALEIRITDEMKPGAILAGGGWELSPPAMNWVPVVDDWEIRHGAWLKPRTRSSLKK